MKSIFLSVLLAGITCLFSGCYRYQYLTLSSDIKQNKEKEFVIENDTLLLKYRFNGFGGPVQVYAYNKLDKPLYIDWSKSSLIMNGRSQSYVTGQAILNGSINGNGYGFTTNSRYSYGNNYSSYRGRLTGTIQSETMTTFIPPKTYIDEKRMAVKTDLIRTDPTAKHRAYIMTNAGLASSKFVTFDEQNSPLQFKSFITLSVNEDLSHSFHFENSFWASELRETTASPNEIGQKPNNQFYNRKSTGVGETFTIIGLIALIAIAAANSPQH